MSTAVVWSLDNCSSCSKAKALLDDKGIHYVQFKLGENCTKDDLIKILPNAQKVPQIFIDNIYIGGYNELVEHFSSN
jgi:glutaredoxin|tara:strand:+ start:5776 stop:6006 length:231 start_codon:yes stop_codon:yes gene_type:complete